MSQPTQHPPATTTRERVALGAWTVPLGVARIISAAPEAVVVGWVALALAAGITVSLGQHRPWLTLPLASLIAWGLWRLVARRGVDVAKEVTGAAWALAGTAVWVSVGLVFSSEYLVVSRDPGFLALTGVWLTDHPSTDIPTLGAVEAAATQGNLLPDAWQAWNLEGDVVQPQGAKMLPAVLAVGGWVGGVTGVLWTNVLIGGACLLALYLMARRLLGPLGALAPAGILGMTVAHIGLSRSPYSEPLTLLLVVAGATWAWRAIDARRWGGLAAAGAVTGATALVRIDGAAYAIGVLAGVTVAGIVVGSWGRLAIVAFAVPQAVLVAAGYLSLWRWSTAYVERLGDESSTLRTVYGIALIGALAGAAVGPALLGAARGVARRALTDSTERVARLAATATVVTLVILASRPLWMIARRGTETSTDQFTNKVVASFQSAEGYPVDPTRTYAEHTITWLSYYLTWPMVLAAFVGFGLLAWLAVARKPGAFVLLGMVAVPSAIYLTRPEIVPDQLWAIRRFEPATLPGFAVAAVVGAWWVAAAVGRYFGDPRRTSRRVAMVTLVVLMVSTYPSVRLSDEERPWSAAVPLGMSEQTGARDEIQGLCDLIDGRPTVLAQSSGYFGSLRVMCDVPVVLALEEPRPESLRAIAEIWGEQPVVVTQNAEWFWDEPPTPALTATVFRSAYALQHLPRSCSPDDNAWYVGVVEDDGSVTPLPPLDGSPVVPTTAATVASTDRSCLRLRRASRRAPCGDGNQGGRVGHRGRVTGS